jgi:hypothetical protein
MDLSDTNMLQRPLTEYTFVLQQLNNCFSLALYHTLVELGKKSTHTVRDKSNGQFTVKMSSHLSSYLSQNFFSF